MHTTTSGKDKAKLNKQEAQIFKKQLTEFDSSYSSRHYYWVYLPSEKKQFKGRILACRLATEFVATQHRSHDSYQYYMTFVELNRRNDQWILPKTIRSQAEEIIQKQQTTKRKGNKEVNWDKYTEHEGMDHQSLLIHYELTKFKTIHCIQLGKYKCDAWYYSAYPTIYHNVECLYLCEFCLNFYILKSELLRHSQQCPLYHPPGDQIYRNIKDGIAVFEIDGLRNQVYCENLSLLSKLFLDHKSLQYDTTVFLYYVLCQIVDGEYHIAGYFSKPKDSPLNLSCILVLPFHQRKGYGKFLISLSYEFTIIEKKIGTPQKPLSDLGRETYLAWWSQQIVKYLRKHKNDEFTIQSIISQTAMIEQDILWTLEESGILKINDGVAHLCVQDAFLNEIFKRGGKQGKQVARQYLHWIPYKVRWQGQSLNY